MTKSQRLLIEQSEKRQRVNTLLGQEEMTDAERTELEGLTGRLQQIEVEYRAAVVVEGEAAEQAKNDAPDSEARERLELRSKARLTGYIMAALQGRLPSGAEAELQQAAGIGDGIPLELWDVPRGEQRSSEARQDAATAAPGTVGVNLMPIRPAVFAPSIAEKLMIEMPRVDSGSFVEATITTSLTAGAQNKGGEAEATAAAFTPVTATPKRISGRLSIRIEDVAAVGQSNFEAALRQNLSLVMSDELDDQIINGDGTAPNLVGMFKRLTDPGAPASGVVGFDGFVEVFADGVDGLWATGVAQVGICCGVDTYRLSARTFRDRVVAEANAAAASLGDVAFSDYAMAKYGGWSTNRRMPAAASNVQQAVLYRKGRSMMGGSEMMRTAVVPIWNSLQIDDIYSGSAKGERYLTVHILAGDLILVQPDAYAQVAFRVSV